MDILAALEATETPASSGLRCVIARFVDDIPDDTPGKANLIATLTTRDRKSPAWRPDYQLDRILLQLGGKFSIKSINDHRANRCRCGS